MRQTAIMCMIIVFISVILANIITLDELHSPAYFRSLILPISDFHNMAVLGFTSFMVSFLQVSIVLVAGNSMVLLDIFSNFGPVILITGLMVGVFTMLGMIIAYAVRTETTSLLASTFFLILNFILAGIITPVERMSAFMSWISSNLPLTLGLSALKRAVFYNIGLYELMDPIAKLTLYFVVLVIILFAARTYCRSKLTNI